MKSGQMAGTMGLRASLIEHHTCPSPPNGASGRDNLRNRARIERLGRRTAVENGLGSIFDLTRVRRPMLWVGFVLAVGVGLSWLAFDAAQRRRVAETERRAMEITHSRVEKLRVSILRSMEVLHSLSALHGIDGDLRTFWRETCNT